MARLHPSVKTTIKSPKASQNFVLPKPKMPSYANYLHDLLLLFFTTVLSQWDFFHGKFRLLSLGKASCDSHTTQPTVLARCFSVSIFNQTLTWTAGSLTCAQMLMHAVAHWSVQTHVCKTKRVCTENWFWEKNPLPHWEWNLHQQCDGPMLYQPQLATSPPT